MKWACPRPGCTYTTTQPDHVTEVIHKCGKGEHPVRLKPVEDTKS